MTAEWVPSALSSKAVSWKVLSPAAREWATRVSRRQAGATSARSTSEVPETTSATGACHTLRGSAGGLGGGGAAGVWASSSNRQVAVEKVIMGGVSWSPLPVEGGAQPQAEAGVIDVAQLVAHASGQIEPGRHGAAHGVDETHAEVLADGLVGDDDLGAHGPVAHGVPGEREAGALADVRDLGAADEQGGARFAANAQTDVRPAAQPLGSDAGAALEQQGERRVQAQLQLAESIGVAHGPAGHSLVEERLGRAHAPVVAEAHAHRVHHRVDAVEEIRLEEVVDVVALEAVEVHVLVDEAHPAAVAVLDPLVTRRPQHLDVMGPGGVAGGGERGAGGIHRLDVVLQALDGSGLHGQRGAEVPEV